MYRYYQCMGTRNATCKGQVSAQVIHDTVFVQAAAMARVPWRLRQSLEAARHLIPDATEAKKDAVRLRREADRLTREREKFLAALRVSPTSVLATLTREMGELENQIVANREAGAEFAAMQASAVPTMEQMQAVFARLGSVWVQASDAERKQVAPDLVESVLCHMNAPEPYATVHYYMEKKIAPVFEGDLRNRRCTVRVGTTVKGE